MNNTFILFYSPEPRSWVWFSKYWNWSIRDLTRPNKLRIQNTAQLCNTEIYKQINKRMNEKNGIFIQVSTHVALCSVIQTIQFVWNVAHPSPAEGKMSLFIHVNSSWSTQTRYPLSVILFHPKNACSRSGKHNIRECTLGFSHCPLWENSCHTQFRCFYPSPDRHVDSLPYKRAERIGASQTHLQLEFVNLNLNTNIILHVVLTLLMFIESRFL